MFRITAFAGRFLQCLLIVPASAEPASVMENGPATPAAKASCAA